MITNSNSSGAKFLETQTKVIAHLTEKYATGRKLEFDKLGEVVLWAKDPQDAHDLVKAFMLDDQTRVDFLSDLTAYDNTDHEDGDKRFVIVYQLYSLELHVRIRVKTLIDIDHAAPTLTTLFSTANWLEREVYDMFGIKFSNHPNLRRILMDERFSGHPLRKEYPIKQREPFKDNIAFHLGANPLEVPTHPTEGDV